MLFTYLFAYLHFDYFGVSIRLFLILVNIFKKIIRLVIKKLYKVLLRLKRENFSFNLSLVKLKEN